MKFVRAIRAGRMTVGPKKREEEKTYNIWGTEAEESTSILARRANHIAAPKVATISMIYIYIYIYISYLTSQSSSTRTAISSRDTYSSHEIISS